MKCWRDEDWLHYKVCLSRSKLTISRLLTWDRPSHSGPPSAGSDILQSAHFDIWLECACSTWGHQHTRRTRWIHRWGWLRGPCRLSPCCSLTSNLDFYPSRECHFPCICTPLLASATYWSQCMWLKLGSGNVLAQQRPQWEHNTQRSRSFLCHRKRLSYHRGCYWLASWLVEFEWLLMPLRNFVASH